VDAAEPGNLNTYQSPDFQSTIGQFVLVFLAIGLLLLLLRARLSWRDAIPSAVFIILSLVALRSVPVMAVVLAPVLGRALRRNENPVQREAGTGQADRSVRVNRILAATISVGFLVTTLAIFQEKPLRLSRFPEAATDYLEREGLQRPPHHLANQDFVGNYLTLRLGRNAWDFIDDRYDMFPVRVSDAYFDLLAGGDKALGVLDRYNVDIVLWEKDKPLAALLQATGKWHPRFEDDKWVILERNR